MSEVAVDDLSTAASERPRGYGRMLLGELRERAIAAGRHRRELDSGVQRFDAHRSYLRERMDIDAHHFRLALRAGGPLGPGIAPLRGRVRQGNQLLWRGLRGGRSSQRASRSSRPCCRSSRPRRSF
ncbi:hypothetical protein GCM10022383_24430 [Microbacterium soli]|uniref:N-acetyltransferase domain-containing protein n=1 Tax=Microbacterium soli TaxID=446075 RepID=A0ABP7NFX6_9MICO